MDSPGSGPATRNNNGIDNAMAVHQQPPPPSHYVDLPELAETFADSIHAMVWDGHTLRIEFCVTRFPEPASATPMEARRYPACRLVLTSAATTDLFDRLQQTMAALAKAGFLSQQKTQPPGSA
jgi:hypothetical protein